MEEALLIVAGLLLVALWYGVKWSAIGFYTLVTLPWRAKRQKAEEKMRREQAAEAEERQKAKRELQRKHQQEAEKERKRFRTENADVFAAIAALKSTCMAPAAEMMRAAEAFAGERCEVVPELIVWADLGNIFASFSKFVKGGDSYIETLWKEINGTIQPSHVKDAPPLSRLPNRGVKQLAMVGILAEYDKHTGTILSSKAASTYLSVVSAVSSHCDGSLAPKMVADKYIELLKPYIHENGGDGYAGYSTSSAGRRSNLKSDCEKCNQELKVLGLPYGASDEEVKSKKRAFAELFHADRLAAMSENARRIALEQHSLVNNACQHILRECKVRERTDSGINGSEPSTAPRQSTREATTEKTTEHRPAPASSSDVTKEATPGNGHTVQSEQDLIDAIDATRSKLEENTRKAQEFLEQMKKRRKRSWERL